MQGDEDREEGKGSPRRAARNPQTNHPTPVGKKGRSDLCTTPNPQPIHGDRVRPGGARHGGAGRVRRRLGQRRRRGPPDPREAAARRRVQAVLRAGPIHLPRPPIRRRRHHLPLYGQRHLRK